MGSYCLSMRRLGLFAETLRAIQTSDLERRIDKPEKLMAESATASDRKSECSKARSA
jgi:hypothetical protein